LIFEIQSEEMVLKKTHALHTNHIYGEKTHEHSQARIAQIGEEEETH
jgi:hypothetical protein